MSAPPLTSGTGADDSGARRRNQDHPLRLQLTQEMMSRWAREPASGSIASLVATRPIRIGAGTNVQDGSIIHADPGHPTLIGANVLIGHLAVIHGCVIEDDAFVGMGAIVMRGAVVQGGDMLAAGAMLTSGKTVGGGELWAGRPAAYCRDLTDQERLDMRAGVEHYRYNAQRFRAEAREWGRAL